MPVRGAAQFQYGLFSLLFILATLRLVALRLIALRRDALRLNTLLLDVLRLAALLLAITRLEARSHPLRHRWIRFPDVCVVRPSRLRR
jgi:hypothetical protein